MLPYLIVGGLLLVSISCGLINPPVHYTLPDGYAGVFKIIRDEKNGEDIKLRNGRYTYEIPDNGILKVKSLAPFEPWHEVSASYRNGTQIPTLSTAADNIVALHSLGTYTRSGGPATMSFVIGTKAEADDFSKLMDKTEFDNIPQQKSPQK